MRRRISGRLGPGGGPGGLGRVRALFPPEPQVLEEGEGELTQEQVVVQAAPAPALEVVQAQLILELLVHLLADPARLDQSGQGLERYVGGEVGQVVLALATSPSATRTLEAANWARSGPLVPVRHEMVWNASGCASISSAAATLTAEGTGCLRGRPVALRSG